MPCRAATSSTPAAQTYGAKPSPTRLRASSARRSRRHRRRVPRQALDPRERPDDLRRAPRAVRRSPSRPGAASGTPRARARPSSARARRSGERASRRPRSRRRPTSSRRRPSLRSGRARASGSGSATWSSRCSGAYASDRASASSSDATRSTRTFAVIRHERLHGRGERGVVGEQQRVAVLAVLGLGEQIGRDELGRRRRVGDHDDLARPGRKVDPRRGSRRGASRR